MKILDATFILQAGERGAFVVEFTYAPEFVRVWNKRDYGDASAKPLLEQVNSKRRYKPCAAHVADLVGLALFAENRAAAEAHEEAQCHGSVSRADRAMNTADTAVAQAARKRARRPKFKMIGGHT